MTLDEFAKILVKLDASNYGCRVESKSTDDEYYNAQREEAGLMDWTSHYGMVVGDDGERKSGLDVRDQQAWIIRKHLAKIVIDGIRFDKDHLDKLGFADNDHMRELGGLVATYYKRNQFMHSFALNSIFYDYFRDWTKNNFDSDQMIDETLTYNMSDGTYAHRSRKFNEESIKKRRSEFIKFWADHFDGRKGEDNRATYNWEPSDEDLKYWIERDWFNYFENDPKRFERVVVMLCETLENNKELKERFKKCVQ
tara:strand:+ start:430 stop:1188 length:759 start_codon:yes stop_codon:yes gene_type:complete